MSGYYLRVNDGLMQDIVILNREADEYQTRINELETLLEESAGGILELVAIGKGLEAENERLRRVLTNGKCVCGSDYCDEHPQQALEENDG